jgi:translation initiation factor 1
MICAFQIVGSRATTAFFYISFSMKTTSSSSRLVYSTEGGRVCPACRQPVATCSCRADAAAQAVPGAGGAIRVVRQTKGRGGKNVTLIQGLPLNEDALAALARQLRNACGAGGTVKAGVVEVQGDHVLRLISELQKAGYAAKRAGG